MKIRTNSGRLNRVALRRGYIERKSTNPEYLSEDDISTFLYYEKSLYHVRRIDYRFGVRSSSFVWKKFKKLTEARAFFDLQPGVSVVIIKKPVYSAKRYV